MLTPWVASSTTARYFNRSGMTPKTVVPDTLRKAIIHGVTSRMNTFRYLDGTHGGRATTETRRQPKQNSATQVVVRCGMSMSGVGDCGDAQRNPGR